MNSTKPKPAPVSKTDTAPGRDRTKSGPTPKRPSSARTVAEPISRAQERKDAKAEAKDEQKRWSRQALLNAADYAPTKRRRTAHWALALAAASVHAAAVVAFADSIGDPLFEFLFQMLPAWATIWLLPGARRVGYHRWLVVVALTTLTVAPYGLAVMVLGHAWVLHRFWAVEFPGTADLTFGRAGKPKGQDTPGRGAKSGASDSAKSGALVGRLRRRGAS